MIIDAHQHVFWHGRNDGDLIKDMDQNNIDVSWLLTWELTRDEWGDLDAGTKARLAKSLNPVHRQNDGFLPGIPLSDLLIAKERYPERFILGYCPNVLTGNAPELFEAAVKMWRVKICGEWKSRMLVDDPRCLNLFRKAGELKCPVVVHLQPPYLRDAQTGRMKYITEWYGGTIDNLEQAVKACPETVFLGHGPGFWREIAPGASDSPDDYPDGPVSPGGKLVAMMEANSNLWADLSAYSALMALRRDPKHAKEFLTRFAERIVFARDYFGDELIKFLHGLNLEPSVQEKIFCKNALCLVPVSGD